MKLEKREITLNEFDSLKDLFYAEKMLIGEYVQALTQAQRKETRAELMRLMKENCEDLCYIRDLMQGACVENLNE